jgi:hypothetical protein
LAYPYYDGLITAPTAIPTNTWIHAALVRSGSTVTIYQNGVSVASGTNSATWDFNNSAGIRISGTPWSGTEDFGGYISNLRVVKGTAVYTSNFTPSTTPLTAISGTSLLTCADNRFIDDSTNNFTVTVAGNTSVQRFSPFSPTAAYSAGTIGGSGYFDGTGDYLQTPTSASLGFGTSDFTMEMWVYSGANGTGTRLGGNGTGASWSSGYWILATSVPSQVNKFCLGVNNTGTDLLVSTSTFNNSQWMHVAITRSGNSWAMFVNGVRESTATSSVSLDNGGSKSITLGQSNIAGDTMWTGYISNFRVVIGTAVYSPSSTTITVPTAPVTAVANTQLLLNYTNAGIIDNTMINNLETVGNAQISSAQTKFGSGSMYFDGTEDWLTTLTNPNLVLGSGDFTVECWIYTGTTGSRSGIIGNRTYPSPDGGNAVWCVVLNPTNSGGFGYIYFHTDATPVLGSSTNFSANTWFHFALTRSGTTFRMFLDGTQVGSTTSSINLSSTATMYVGKEGARSDQSGPLNGYMDDFRITKGYARYTSNFTPPTSAFPTY